MREKTKKIISFNIDSDAVEKLKLIIPKNELSKRINQLILDEVDKNSYMLDEPENIRILKKELGLLNIQKIDMKHRLSEIDIHLPLIESKIIFIVSEIERLKNKGDK